MSSVTQQGRLVTLVPCADDCQPDDHQIPAVYQMSNEPGRMQPISPMRTGSNTDTDTFQSPVQSSAGQHHYSRHADQPYTTFSAAVASPASVKPKQYPAAESDGNTDTGINAGYDSDCHQGAVDRGAAAYCGGGSQSHQAPKAVQRKKKTTRPARKGQKAKSQGLTAELVMPRCYASTLGPVVQDDGQVDSQGLQR